MSLAAAVPAMSHAGEAIQRTVRGTVVATNVEANPQIIVVKVLLPSKEEMIVGARVSADTKITKGKQAAQLADLKAGQMAEVTYLKTSEGLLAQSIRAH
jgi:predicted phosphoribosyltransferase